MEQVNLNFAQTFQPERQHISNLIISAENIKMMSPKEISIISDIPQGVSSGKVEPHIMYAHYMGLLDYTKNKGKYSTKLTDIGLKIRNEDPGLMETITVQLCHCMILRDKEGAPIWSYLFNYVLPKYRGRVSLEMVMKEMVSHFGNKLTPKNFAPLCGSYEGFFNKLNLIDIPNKNSEEFVIHQLSYNPEYIYLYCYVLYVYWADKYAGREEITSEELDKLGFSYAFGWSKNTQYQVLEHLSDKGLIRLNRQISPFTVLRLSDMKNAIEKLYSELC